MKGSLLPPGSGPGPLRDESMPVTTRHIFWPIRNGYLLLSNRLVNVHFVQVADSTLYTEIQGPCLHRITIQTASFISPAAALEEADVRRHRAVVHPQTPRAFQIRRHWSSLKTLNRWFHVESLPRYLWGLSLLTLIQFTVEVLAGYIHF